MPPNTQEGKNTFGCNLNGDVWLPNASCGYFSNPCAGMSVSVFRPFAADTFPLGITITVQKKISNVTTYIQMVTKNILTNSAAYVYSPGNIYDSLRINYTNQNGIQYHTLDGKPGIVNITRLDVKNEIISGNFNFTLFIQGGDSLVFSDGRFDLKFNVCKCY